MLSIPANIQPNANLNDVQSFKLKSRSCWFDNIYIFFFFLANLSMVLVEMKLMRGRLLINTV